VANGAASTLHFIDVTLNNLDLHFVERYIDFVEP
jgi:hypothetical protein